MFYHTWVSLTALSTGTWTKRCWQPGTSLGACRRAHPLGVHPLRLHPRVQAPRRPSGSGRLPQRQRRLPPKRQLKAPLPSPPCPIRISGSKICIWLDVAVAVLARFRALGESQPDSQAPGAQAGGLLHCDSGNWQRLLPEATGDEGLHVCLICLDFS